ncbi:MAG: hypothetical protein ACHREM_01075 [Polyangiales bacterium]
MMTNNPPIITETPELARAVEALHADMLDEHGYVRARPAAEFRAMDRTAFMIWCYRNARYGLPTVELVAWIKDRIGGRPAIEIGAGMGDLGNALRIPMTDSGAQDTPELRTYYRAMGQRAIVPPRDVARMGGNAAVASYRPSVVVASWVTQRFRPGDTERDIGAFAEGVDELTLLEHVHTYIFLGNKKVHGDKRILAQPHEEHALPFLVSRALAPELDVVWVWERKR